MKKLIATLAFAMLVVGGTPAHAQYPERDVTLIVPFAPGGSTDVHARLLVPFVEKYLGASIVVENRPGAGGMIGATAVARAAPDGYTIGTLNFSSMFSPIHQGTAQYDLDDFTPIIAHVTESLGLIVHPEGGIESVADFVEQAASSGGALTIGVTGIGHPGHIAALMLQNEAGFEAVYVPFNGGTQARTAILGKHITIGMLGISEMLPSYEQGQVRILAVASPERLETLPDVPTLVEAGYDVVFQSVNGFAAPANLPDAVREKLVSAFEQAAQDPEYLELAKARAVPVGFLPHEDYTEFLVNSNAALGEIWNTNPWIK